jgi:hypothetical protein
VYKPIPWVYNLLVSMLWRHPEKVQLGKAKVVHYCALVRADAAVVLDRLSPANLH